jgi:hypothetical protein
VVNDDNAIDSVMMGAANQLVPMRTISDHEQDTPHPMEPCKLFGYVYVYAMI